MFGQITTHFHLYHEACVALCRVKQPGCLGISNLLDEFSDRVVAFN